MRTTDPACSLAFRPPRSPGVTAARRFLHESSTATAPRTGIKTTRTFTSRPSEDLAGGARGGHGAARASSPPSPTSSGDTGGGRPRRTSGRITVSPATQRCGAGSGTSPQRSSLQAPEGNETARPRGLEVSGELAVRPLGVLGVPRARSEICRRSLGDPSEIAHPWTPARPDGLPSRPAANQARQTVCQASQVMWRMKPGGPERQAAGLQEAVPSDQSGPTERGEGCTN